MSLFDVITEETALDMMKTTYQLETRLALCSIKSLRFLIVMDVYFWGFMKMSTACLSRSLTVLMTRILMQWPLLARWSIK